ncbi:MAG: hypothetical protein A2511_08280 [Deltaproteobacteria bacterium RIFOXYD12_FULL_50_9]|nr:MAG: hypothetical protein A2511_08280 [Deltaproteobacteria bacterium RIFOXYD12_FULL_50_9]
MVKSDFSRSNIEKNYFGLTDRDMQTMLDIFIKYPEVQTVFVFGSRAKQTHKPGSDIDLAIMNAGVRETVISKIKGDFDESSLPYTVDLVNYPVLNHAELKNHIDRVGVLFYQKEGFYNLLKKE